MSRLTMLNVRLGDIMLQVNVRPKDKWWYDVLCKEAEQRGHPLGTVVADVLRTTMVSVSDQALLDELREIAEQRDCSLSAAARTSLKEYASRASTERPFTVGGDLGLGEMEP